LFPPKSHIFNLTNAFYIIFIPYKKAFSSIEKNAFLILPPISASRPLPALPALPYGLHQQKKQDTADTPFKIQQHIRYFR
jgi:hypothetical protein